MANYSQRRTNALRRLQELVAARNAWDNLQYRRVEQEEAARKQEELAAEAAANKNWMDEAASGAKMGSAAGPWGALVGAIAGTAMGQKKAYDQRRKEGQGKWDAFTRTHFDTPGGSAKLNRQNMADMTGAYTGAKAQKDQQDARESTALAEAESGKDYADYQNSMEVTRTGQYGGTYNAHPKQSASTPGDYWDEKDTSQQAYGQYNQYDPNDPNKKLGWG